MKLAEALILRADCQKRIAQLKSRLLTNAKVQEGDAPAETPQDLIVDLERASSELLDLIKRINKTNSATVLAGRGTISDALAERDVLALQRTAYADLAQMGAITQGRITRSKVKYSTWWAVADWGSATAECFFTFAGFSLARGPRPLPKHKRRENFPDLQILTPWGSSVTL